MAWTLAIFCLTVISGCWSQAAIEEVQINVDISLSRAQVGDVVTLYCTVYDMPTDGYIYWFKTVMAGEKGEIFEVVALSDQPMPPYDRFPRLKFSSASSGNTKGYTLKLDGVMAEDNGHWGCSYRDVADNIYDSEILEVYDDIDDIFVRVNGTLMPDAGIMTVADEPISLEINATRANPRPVISVYVDNDDITDQLSYSSKTRIQCAQQDPNKNCSLTYSISTKAFGDYTFNGNQDLSTLLVVAHVPGSGFEPTNKSYPLTIDHSPMFGVMTEQHARRGANFTITSTVQARPVAAMDLIYWRMVRDEQETYLFMNEYSDDWQASVSMEHVDETTCDVSLTLYLITDYHYTKYELFAGNEYGNNSVEINLGEDFSPPVGPSSASFLTSSIMVVVSAILFSCTRYD